MLGLLCYYDFRLTYLHSQCWRAVEGTCCFSAGAWWAAGCGYWGRSRFQAGSTAVRWGYCRGGTRPCRSWREADPAGQIRSWLTSLRSQQVKPHRWKHPLDCTYTEPLSVDHQVDVFVDLAIFVVWLWALARRVVGLDVGAVAAV